MAAKLVHYVEFYFPSEIEPTKIFNVASRDLIQLKILDGAYAFKFFDVLTGQVAGVKLRSARINVSGMHFIDAHIKQIKHVLQVTGPDLISLIADEKWERAVYCRDDTFREFKRGDSIVPSKFKKK